MKKSIVVVFCLFLLGCNNKEKTKFILNGDIEDTLSVDKLILYSDTIYSEVELLENPTRLKKNRFLFQGDIGYPHAFTLLSMDKTKTNMRQVSELFFIDAGNNNISFLYSKERIVNLNSKSDKEYMNVILPLITKGEEKLKGKPCRSSCKDSIIVDYLGQNSKSYVALWLLVESLSTTGYNKHLESSLSLFSDEIKLTKTYKVFESEVKRLKKINIGGKFPLIPLQDVNFKKQKIVFSKAKYTLIDFWFSHCGSCINEFPIYKDIYSRYKDKGFEMVSISTDETKYIDYWKEIIEKHEIDWPQYLDENGVESRKLYIRIFPTTFLIDNNGVIVHKYISPEFLEKFLEKKLN